MDRLSWDHPGAPAETETTAAKAAMRTNRPNRILAITTPLHWPERRAEGLTVLA
jgi:hypothetical protein